METSIIIAGSGGQGILFLGKMLTASGMLEQKSVTWFPSYGAEMRGGTANCTVIVSDEMIGSPVVLHPDILVAMNKASLERFLPRLKKKGLLLYDSSLITSASPSVSAMAVPATAIAGAAGSTKAANMAMLGALVALTGLVSQQSVIAAFGGGDPSRARALELNKTVFSQGVDYIEAQKSRDRRH